MKRIFSWHFLIRSLIYLTKKNMLKHHYQQCRQMISFRDAGRKQLQSLGSKIPIPLQPVFTSMKLGNILKDKGAETEDRIWSK